MSDSIWERQFEQHESEVAVAEPVWVEEPISDPEEPVSEDIISLLNLGKLTYEMNVRGHKIVLRTLTMGEELEIGLLLKPFIGTVEEGRALATAIVAASIESFDGNPLVRGIGPEENLLHRKFDYVRTRMYWPVIRLIYEEGYIPLAARQSEAIEDFQKK